jgi:putative copper resistance protein D
MTFATGLAAALCFLLFTQTAKTQDHPMHKGHEGTSMKMEGPEDAASQVEVLADRRGSELNHHLAGLFVIVAGVFVLFEAKSRSRWPALKYAWPASFLALGVFLLVWSDTELRPFAQRHWLDALENNREVLQHKIFALLLLLIGTIEWLRAKGRLKAAWSGWVFPMAGIVGSVLLLFHVHKGGMHGPNHMAVMARIQSEHLSFAIVGFGIAVTKGLAETEIVWRDVFAKVWPLLMITLGVLLLSYRE